MIKRCWSLSLLPLIASVAGCAFNDLLDGVPNVGGVTSGRPPPPAATPPPGMPPAEVPAPAVRPPDVPSAVAPSDVSGCWRLSQDDYGGTLTLQSDGPSVTGFMDWENHADARVSGSIAGNKLTMTFTYGGDKAGVVGFYEARVRAHDTDDRSLVDGATYDVAIPDRVVAWSGSSIPCKALTGCFIVEQTNRDGGAFAGTFELQQTGEAITGSATWANHAPGVLAGRLNGRALHFTQTFPGTDKEGLVGSYSATVTPSGDELIAGTSHSNSGDDAIWNGRRAGCRP